jgi:hypothetical protein
VVSQASAVLLVEVLYHIGAVFSFNFLVPVLAEVALQLFGPDLAISFPVYPLECFIRLKVLHRGQNLSLSLDGDLLVGDK